MSRLKIGIVGCGAIGSSLARAIVKDFSKEAELAALYDTDIIKAKALARKLLKKDTIVVVSLDRLINKSLLIIEAASAKSSLIILRRALGKKRDIMVMSVGGIISHFDKLYKLAKKNKCKVYIPSGAISGIDALKAANMGGLKSVTLCTRKNPKSFTKVKYIEQKGIHLDTIKKDTVLFSGTAREAVKYFPKNINVASILSIAGLGQYKTCVKIIASPSTKKNIHEIQIESHAGKITTRTENILHPENPKTSFLAVLSAVATLKQILSPIKIGT